MFSNNLRIIDEDLEIIAETDRSVFEKKVCEKINNNLKNYKIKIQKAFSYMLEVSNKPSVSILKKVVKEETE